MKWIILNTIPGQQSIADLYDLTSLLLINVIGQNSYDSVDVLTQTQNTGIANVSTANAVYSQTF